MSPAEAEFKALRNEVDGWKLVAEQSEQMQKKAERELKIAQRTIQQFEQQRDRIETAARARAEAAVALATAEGGKENASSRASLSSAGARAKIEAAGIKVQQPRPPRPGSGKSGASLEELLDSRVQT